MSLQHYLQLAYKESRLTSAADLAAFQHLTGTLQRGRENLILVYGGSFNPPHRGHIDVLLSGLAPSVGALGIVVLPSEDFHLRHKVAKSHPEFFLRMERRAEIWAAIVPPHSRDRVWVWASTWYPFKTFTDALVRLTKADGFELAFSHLIGPDNVNPDDPLDILPYRLPRILVSNRGRHVATGFSSDGSPTVWKGFGGWSRCANEKGQAEDSDTVLWTCVGADGARGYYLQSAGPAYADISSTNLREMFVRSQGLDEGRLNQLSTETLLGFLAPMLP